MLHRTHCALVVVDFQGKLAQLVHESEAVLRNARILIEGMKILDIPILATEQYPKGLGHTVPEIMDALGEAPVYEKGTFSCCGDPGFLGALKATGRNDVILCGIETHVCVYQTARDLLDDGYNVHLVTDAVSSRTEANKQLAIRKVEMMGAKLTGTEMALFELLHVSGTEQFKAISKLVK